jgi:peptidoglycan/LPS O-acetylase OafA/YrhL
MPSSNTKIAGTLERFASGRSNNFDFLRFLAATLVIFSHSFSFSTASGWEPLLTLTRGQSTLGGVGLGIFFVVSGFLVTQSFENSRSIARFLKARVLRIFPALAVVVCLSVFLLGPLLTSLSLGAYLSNSATYNYLSQLLLDPSHYSLPGVFGSNVQGSLFNGPLWTLSFEF